MFITPSFKKSLIVEQFQGNVLNPYCVSKGWFSLAGFHESRSQSRNQKRKAIRSSENQTDGVGSRTLILLMTPSLTIK